MKFHIYSACCADDYKLVKHSIPEYPVMVKFAVDPTGTGSGSSLTSVRLCSFDFSLGHSDHSKAVLGDKVRSRIAVDRNSSLPRSFMNSEIDYLVAS